MPIHHFSYPIFLNLYQKKCLVIGGGSVANRKVSTLLKSGACVTVITKKASPFLSRLQQKGKIQVLQRAFRARDLKGAWIVIAATDKPPLNHTIARLALSNRQWVNVVDRPELCQFIAPSSIQRGNLTLAISTNGISPGLSKAIRKELERNFIPKYQKILRRMKLLRQQVRSKVEKPEQRKGILNHLVKQMMKTTS